MLPIFADVIRIATFQDDRRRDRRYHRDELRARREIERLTEHLAPYLRRDIGLD